MACRHAFLAFSQPLAVEDSMEYRSVEEVRKDVEGRVGRKEEVMVEWEHYELDLMPMVKSFLTFQLFDFGVLVGMLPFVESLRDFQEEGVEVTYEERLDHDETLILRN